MNRPSRAIVVAAWMLLLPVCSARGAGWDATLSASPAEPPPHPAPAALPARFAPCATEHYVVATNGDALWAMFTGDLLERFRLRFMQAFRSSGFELAEPAEPLVWLGFRDDGDYRDHARREDRLNVAGMPAYYSCRSNRVAILLAGASPARRGRIEVERIRHEAAHQLAYNLGLMKRGVMYPLWLAEGLATSFETFGEGTAVLTADNPVRRTDLLTGLQNGRLAPLADFVVMAHLPSTDRQTAVALYGQSWGFWQFLLRTRPEPLRHYMRSLARLPMGRRPPQQLRGEFTEAFGPIDRVEAEWRHYLHDLAAAPADGGDRP